MHIGSGERILLADGIAELQVDEVQDDRLLCSVIIGGKGNRVVITAGPPLGASGATAVIRVDELDRTFSPGVRCVKQAGGLMHLKDIFKVGVLALVIAFLALACASSEPKSDFELDVNDDEITVALSQAVARGVMEELMGSDLECEDGADGEFRAFLERLDRGGSRAKTSYRDGETSIDGRRRGSKLDLKIRGAGSGKIEATMPWAVAECMLGKSTSIDESFTSVKVKVTNEDGRNFSFRLR